MIGGKRPALAFPPSYDGVVTHANQPSAFDFPSGRIAPSGHIKALVGSFPGEPVALLILKIAMPVRMCIPAEHSRRSVGAAVVLIGKSGAGQAAKPLALNVFSGECK